MKQRLIGGFYDLLNASATEYNAIAGGVAWTGTENHVTTAISPPGTIRKLRVKLSAAPGAGKSYTFTLRYAASGGAMADSTLTVTISGDATTSGADVSHDVAVAAGGKVSISCVPSGTPTAVYATWTMEFEGTNAKESLLIISAYCYSSSTTYVAVGYVRGASYTANEAYCYRPCPTAGKIKNLYVELSVDPGTSPDAYRFTLRQDTGGGMANTTLTTTITANNKTGNDTSHEVIVSVGDILSFMIEPLNSPGVASSAFIGMTFEATADGESLILGGTYDDLHTTDTEYAYLCPGPLNAIWTATEGNRYQLGQTCTFKNLYIKLSAAPGSGKSHTFTVRDPGGSTGITVTIADANTAGNDTAHTHDIADDEYVGLESSHSGTPAVGDSFWGLVCYIATFTAWGPYAASKAIGLTTVASRLATYTRTASKGIGLTTVATKAYGWSRTASCAIGLTITASRQVAYTRVASKAIGLTTTASRLAAYTRTASKAIGLTTVATRVFGRTRTASKAIGLTISASRQVAYIRTASKAIGLTTSATRTVNWTRAASKTIGLTVVASRTVAYIRTASKAIGLTTHAAGTPGWAYGGMRIFNRLRSYFSLEPDIRDYMAITPNLRDYFTITPDLRDYHTITPDLRKYFTIKEDLR
jgi:hypothetical protein